MKVSNSNGVNSNAPTNKTPKKIFSSFKLQRSKF